MAFLKIVNEAYKEDVALDNLIFYIAMKSEISGGWGISNENPEAVIAEFKAVKRFWNKTGGRQVKHFILSWDRDIWLHLEQIRYVAAKFTLFFQPDYQVYWGVHLDTDNQHIHVAVNTVSYFNGKMMSFGQNERNELCSYKDDLMRDIRQLFRLKKPI